MKSGLRTHLLSFDGKDVDMLEALRQVFPASRPLMAELVQMATDEEGHVQSAATWLLRRHMADGERLAPKEVGLLGAALGDVTDPWARQHLCQSIGSIAISVDHHQNYAAFLRACCEAERPFLRAWGVDGLYRLSLQHTELAEEVEQRLASARGDEAASVTARVRNIDLERGA
ncbi:MAG: hypothetical protein DRQ55_08940 [Planctomycetota bacterium]|nr:MAG: hypothetical protein DRQ55_08940 [Planctomycetota bacterium]